MCVSEDTSAVKTDWENVQMWVIVKTWCFYSFAMNSQSKVKNILAHYSCKIYQEKLAMKFDFMVGSLSWSYYKFSQQLFY